MTNGRIAFSTRSISRIESGFHCDRRVLLSPKSKKTSIRSPWQNPYAERVIGTLRQELLNHIIPVTEKHLHYLLKEYIQGYYNPHRTHQGIHGQTPIPSPTYLPTTVAKTKLKSTPVLSGLYHSYKKAA
ncbi:transposase [Heliobacillus mobilis]|uniref:Transposase n=1 Tax=Heliobacterium mobile TaxID=28064 RepID=A0A6I3SKX5_HELMO|nr:integrase core domain-containing protein [Heliobacterium mobile]MTV49618.1 transposase [Heliobacterium mobile]